MRTCPLITGKNEKEWKKLPATVTYNGIFIEQYTILRRAVNCYFNDVSCVLRTLKTGTRLQIGEILVIKMYVINVETNRNQH